MGFKGTPEFGRHFEAFHSFCLGLSGLTDKSSYIKPNIDTLREALLFIGAVGWFSFGRRLCRTRNGRAGLVPSETRLGDDVCIFLEVPIPFVVRKKGDHYQLVGPCCVRNMTDGQAFESGD
jgi:hypothetical protein